MQICPFSECTLQGGPVKKLVEMGMCPGQPRTLAHWLQERALEELVGSVPLFTVQDRKLSRCLDE